VARPNVRAPTEIVKTARTTSTTDPVIDFTVKVFLDGLAGA